MLCNTHFSTSRTSFASTLPLLVAVVNRAYGVFADGVWKTFNRAELDGVEEGNSYIRDILRGCSKNRRSDSALPNIVILRDIVSWVVNAYMLETLPALTEVFSLLSLLENDHILMIV